MIDTRDLITDLDARSHLSLEVYTVTRNVTQVNPQLEDW